MNISIVLITLNEEMNIVDCLNSASWADEIVVVDSGSTDKTVDLVSRYTTKIYHHPFKNFSDQKNYALSKASGDWIFLIDADERFSRELSAEIQSFNDTRIAEAAYQVHRETYFFKKRLRFSGTQNDVPIRFFPRGKVSYEQPVHEEIRTQLPVKRLKSPLLHHSTRDLSHYKIKLKQYIALELETMAMKRKKVHVLDSYFRPVAKFIFLYFFQFGILDGFAGLQMALLSSYYDYLKFRRYMQLLRNHHAS